MIRSLLALYMANNTIQALLRRGIDSILATRLVAEGHTIESLKTKNATELTSLGLHTLQANALLDETRPSIPEDTFLSVVHASKWVCCICRDTSKGIIIHHLKEWSKSRSHDFDNLALLCLQHHDEAHTVRELSLMLKPERIKALRDKWYQQVKEEDKLAIAGQLTNISEDEKPLHNMIIVSDAQSLMDAIRSNVIIRLTAGKYNLSRVAKTGTNPHVVWMPVHNGYEPHILDVENIKIVGEEGTEIVIEPSYTWVLKFKNCRSVSIENIIAGHVTPGSCAGGVFMFHGCAGLAINKCTLYGSGTYGITLQNSSTVIVHETVIKECTYGMLQVFNSDNVLFRYCRLMNCKEFDLITIKDKCSNINFLHCDFSYNIIGPDYFFIDTDDTCKGTVIEYCNLNNNAVSLWTNFPAAVLTRQNTYSSNRFASPEDVSWYYDED
jgi:hypothetical protein